jgi:hypothetical protein
VAVSVVRAGETMENVMREMFPEVPIGKVVIRQFTDRSLGPRVGVLLLGLLPCYSGLFGLPPCCFLVRFVALLLQTPFN